MSARYAAIHGPAIARSVIVHWRPSGEAIFVVAYVAIESCGQTRMWIRQSPSYRAVIRFLRDAIAEAADVTSAASGALDKRGAGSTPPHWATLRLACAGSCQQKSDR